MKHPTPTRCFITSAGVHLGLLALLVAASGFQRSRLNVLSLGSPIELMSGELVDAALAGPPRSIPQANVARDPEPPAPAPTRDPAPREAEVEPQLPRKPTPAPKPTSRPPSQNTTPVVVEPTIPTPRSSPDRSATPAPKPKEKPAFDFNNAKVIKDPAKRPSNASDARAAGRAAEEAARARSRTLDRQMANAAGALAGLASRSALAVGIVGGGASGSLNATHVRNAFDAAWALPPNVTDDHSTTEVEVVIRGDGTVVRTRITRRSGVAGLDRSVEEALRKVREIRPFEPFGKDEEITFTIAFNVQAKNQL